MSKFKIITHDYYSNCFIEAIKAKLKDWNNVTLTICMPQYNEVFCPHFLWSDGKYDYDFGYEGYLNLFAAWTLHKGHIRQRELGYNNRYRNTMLKWKQNRNRKNESNRTKNI